MNYSQTSWQGGGKYSYWITGLSQSMFYFFWNVNNKWNMLFNISTYYKLTFWFCLYCAIDGFCINYCSKKSMKSRIICPAEFSCFLLTDFSLEMIVWFNSHALTLKSLIPLPCCTFSKCFPSFLIYDRSMPIEFSFKTVL